MKFDPDEEVSPQEPVTFELANGNAVRVEAGWFWQKPTPEEKKAGGKPFQYNAVRIFSSEGSLRGKLLCHGEFRAHNEFDPERLDDVWSWLQEHVSSRDYCSHDNLEDFIEALAEVMSESLCFEEDAVEHYRRLPDLTDPEAFDRVDDSLFNDQMN